MVECSPRPTPAAADCQQLSSPLPAKEPTALVRGIRFKHSNTAENLFSIFQRGVISTYHHMSEAHLGRYTTVRLPLQNPLDQRQPTSGRGDERPGRQSPHYQRNDKLVA